MGKGPLRDPHRDSRALGSACRIGTLCGTQRGEGVLTEFLKNNFQRQIYLEEFAQLASMSNAALKRHFRVSPGMPLPWSMYDFSEKILKKRGTAFFAVPPDFRAF